MRKLLMASIAAMALGGSAANASTLVEIGNRGVLSKPEWGCPSLQDWGAIESALAEHDTVGVTQASQPCRQFARGETLLVLDFSLLHGATLVRAASDPDNKWWISTGVGSEVIFPLPPHPWYAGGACGTQATNGDLSPDMDVADDKSLGYQVVEVSKISDTETDVSFAHTGDKTPGVDHWFTTVEACHAYQKAQNARFDAAFKPDGEPPATTGPALAASLVGKHVFDYGGAPLCHDKAGILDWWKTGNDGSGPDYPAPKGCIIPADGGVVGIVDRAEGGFVHLTDVHETDEHNKTVPIGLADGTTARGDWTAGWSVFRDRKNTTVLHPLGNGKYGPATDDGPPDQLWCRDDNSKCNGS